MTSVLKEAWFACYCHDITLGHKFFESRGYVLSLYHPMVCYRISSIVSLTVGTKAVMLVLATSLLEVLAFSGFKGCF